MFAEGAGFAGAVEDAGAAGALGAFVEALALVVSEADFLERDFLEVVPEESAVVSDFVEAVDSLELAVFEALVSEASLFLDLEDFLEEAPEAESALASDFVEAADSLEVELAALVPEVSLFLDLEDFLEEELEASVEA